MCIRDSNSVVATFCHNIAHGLPIEVRDPAYSLPLVYIDDAVQSFLAALEGRAARDCSLPGYCHLMCDSYEVTLGELARLIESFRDSRRTLAVPDMADPFTKKLYATYLSYLPPEAFSYPLDMHCDARGSFTEFLRSPERGQVSVNVAKPGVVKMCIRDSVVHGVVEGDGDDLLVQLALVPHGDDTDGIAAHQAEGRDGLAGQHQHVQRIAVVGIGAGDQPIVGRVVGGGVELSLIHI